MHISVLGHHLVTVEDWGEEIFPKGVGVSKNSIYYLAISDKITPALQATLNYPGQREHNVNTQSHKN